MFPRNSLFWCAAILSLAFAVSPSRAVTFLSVPLLNDTLDVGATPTIGDDGDDPLDTAWVVGNSSPTITRVNDAGGIGTGFAVNVNTGGTFQAARGSFPYASLLIGESLELNLDARLTQSPASVASGFRAGLFNLFGIGGGSSGSTGYYAAMGVGGDTGLSASRDNGGNGGPGGGSDTGFLTGGNVGAPFASINDLNSHSIQVIVTRTGATTSTTDIVVDGVARTGMDTDGTIVEAFDTVVVAEGNVNADYRFDNIAVTHHQSKRIVVTGDPADMEVQELTNGNTTQLLNPTNMLVGHGGGNGGWGRNALIVLELPERGELTPAIVASLSFQLVQKDAALPFNGDLWGLGSTSDANDLSDFDDYFYSTIAPSSATLIEAGILTASTPLGLVETMGAGDAALAAFLQSLYDNGAEGGDFAVLSLTPSVNPFLNGGTFDRYHIASGSTATPPTLTLAANIVPEPATATLSLVGLAGLLLRRRRAGT